MTALMTRAEPDTAARPPDAIWLDLFAARLGANVLGSAERAAMRDALICSRSYGRGERIVEDDGRRQPLNLVTHGWAARVQMVKDGSQQITDFILPGELCDFPRIVEGRLEKVVALTLVRVALLDCDSLRRAAESHPSLRLALLHLALNEQGILRQWLVCLGRRGKKAHLAHLLCELHQRLRRAGLAADHQFDLPLTQEQLADATGMTPIHTNRMLQQLRKEGVISLGNHHLRIIQPARLRQMGEFEREYLEL